MENGFVCLAFPAQDKQKSMFISPYFSTLNIFLYITIVFWSSSCGKIKKASSAGMAPHHNFIKISLTLALLMNSSLMAPPLFLPPVIGRSPFRSSRTSRRFERWLKNARKQHSQKLNYHCNLFRMVKHFVAILQHGLRFKSASSQHIHWKWSAFKW